MNDNVKVVATRDTKTIYTMDRICLPADDPVKLTDAKWWIAKRDGVTAGYAGAKVLLSSNAVYLCRAGVLPDHRGHHIQRDMIAARVKWARRMKRAGEADLQSVITDTATYNISSANNLIASGFVLYRPEVPWRDGEHTNYWWLTL